MSDDLSSRSCVIVDDGQFFELAIRLSKEFGKVYYHNPSLIEGFPKANKFAIGQGFDELEWLEELWPHKDNIDLFIFPDILNSGIQSELFAQGKRVIGSRTGDRLEVKRIAFKKVQEKLGISAPKYDIVHGLDALHKHLREHDDLFIKISKFRGSFETEHHINYELSVPWLNKLAVELGPLADDVAFLCEVPIKHKVEFGYDGFCFDGQLPEFTLFGPEIKSKCYIGAWTAYKDLDERLREITEALALELKQDGYRNFLSNEIIFADGDENFPDGTAICLEPTCRIPSPPFESEMQVYKNLGAMLWHGSVGEAMTPESAAAFTVECRIKHDGEADGWRSLRIPDSVREWVKLYDCYKKGDVYHIAPKPPHAERIGAVVGNGDTIEKAIDHCRQNLDAIKDQPICSEFEALAQALKEIKAAEEQDIEFSEQPIPGCAEVMAD